MTTPGHTLTVILLVTMMGYFLVEGENPAEEIMGFVNNAKDSDLQNQWINKHQYTVLINEENKCAGDVFLLVTVLSAPDNLEIRETIRQTYGTVQEYERLTVRFIFLLGASAIESLEHVNPRLKRESDTYHDIIKGNFIDTYNNLTYKTVFGLHWVYSYCRKAHYVLKIDDDTILNVYKLLYFLQDLHKQHRGTKHFLYCNSWSFSRPVRTESSKF